jgi:hypothetical protein
MKQYRFEIFFRNGEKHEVHAPSFRNAIIKAAAWAIDEGIDTFMKTVIGHFDSGPSLATSIVFDIGYDEVGDPALATLKLK